ncbi:MAG: hypothetical protein V4683_14180 [Bacteroidota bacterium]
MYFLFTYICATMRPSKLSMNKNRKIFIICFFLFLAIVIALVINMANQTTAPWNKKKQLDRVISR